ncbi:MAG: PAS domain-containing protein [Anaerolineae bacterium]|nr:PAS domain-containing protein [Anaerolineae bacterium]
MQESKIERQGRRGDDLAAERLVRRICTDLVRLPYEALGEGIDEALRLAGQFCGADRSYVFLFRDGTDWMDNTHEWCAPGVEPQILRLQALSSADFPWWMAHLRRGEPIVVPDVSSLPPEAEAEREILRAQSIESVVVLPLVASGELLGFIGFDWVRPGAAAFDREAHFLHMVGEAVANAIHRGRVEGRLQEARSLSEALDRVDAAVSATFDLDMMMAAVMQECLQALKADAVAVILREQDEWVIAYASGHVPGLVGRRGSEAQFPLCGRVAQRRRLVMIEDIASSQVSPGSWLLEAGYQACLGVPLLTDHRVKGVLSFSYCRPTAFTRAQREFATHLSALISLALERSRLYQAEIRHRRFLQSVTDSIPVGMAVVDGESLRLKWINSGGLALLGEPYRSLAVPGVPISDLVPDGEASRLAHAIRTVRDTGVPCQQEEARLDGLPRGLTYWWVTVMPSESPDGGRDVLIVAREVTESVRARQRVEELAASLEHERDVLRAIMDNTDTYLAYLNRRLELVRVNANFADALGTTAESLVGRSFFDVLPDLEVRRVFEWGRDSGLPVRFHERGFTFPRSREFGPEYWDWSLVPVKNSKGEVVGLVLCLLDVTASVRARGRIEELAAESQQRAAELEEERARLRAVIESAPEAIVVCDREGRVQLANRAAEGLRAHPLVGGAQPTDSDAARVCHGDLRPYHPDELPLARSARHGEVCAAEEVILLWGDGRRRDLRASSAPILDREGYITGAVAVYQDITDIKAAERERAHLEEMKSEFLASVSHELRTPLASIKGYTELLLDGGAGLLSPLQKEFLGTVFESGERLEWLIDDLLDVSRLESNRFDMEMALVRPGELLRSSVARIQPVLEELVVDLVVEEEPPLPEIRGDPRRLEQVVSNLLSNAVKFTPPGGKIVVSARQVDGKTLEIAVSDTGVGIPADDLPHLFQRFFRGHNVTESGVSGTGLGLYISKAIVDMHGGTIEAESELNRGSTFRVRLPIMGPTDGESV